jgi:hypothetical protein
MTRGEIFFDERFNWPVSLVAVAVLALLGSLAYMAMQPAPEFESRPPSAVRRPADFGASSAFNATPTTTLPTAPEPPRAPAAAAATQPRDRAVSAPNRMPYRFMGKSTQGAASSILLFGRGRIVTLSGPGPLDDEYAVEAVFDDYLVLRHLPTGAGAFLEYARPQQVVELPRDPEESPRD